MKGSELAQRIARSGSSNKTRRFFRGHQLYTQPSVEPDVVVTPTVSYLAVRTSAVVCNQRSRVDILVDLHSTARTDKTGSYLTKLRMSLRLIE